MTGVQTCALPISHHGGLVRHRVARDVFGGDVLGGHHARRYRRVCGDVRRRHDHRRLLRLLLGRLRIRRDGEQAAHEHQEDRYRRDSYQRLGLLHVSPFSLPRRCPRPFPCLGVGLPVARQPLIFFCIVAGSSPVLETAVYDDADCRVLVGRKGAKDEPGTHFCPYILAETYRTIAEATMAPKLMVKSRYALVDAGFFPETQYLTFVVDPVGI